MLGETEYRISTMLGHGRTGLVDVSIGSTMKGECVKIELSYGETVSKDIAETLSEALVKTVERFLDGPEDPVLESPIPQTDPLPIERYRPASKQQAQGYTRTGLDAAVVNPRIATVWKSFLSQRRGIAVKNRQSTASFSDLGGYLIDAAYMADSLQKEGFKVTVDDILEHSTLETLSEKCSKKLNENS